jgi:hypothetical protein
MQRKKVIRKNLSTPKTVFPDLLSKILQLAFDHFDQRYQKKSFFKKSPSIIPPAPRRSAFFNASYATRSIKLW